MKGTASAVAMVCLAYGCGSGGSAPAAKTAEHPAGTSRASPPPRAKHAALPVEEKTRASLDAESEVEAQVRALRQAIALYGQFIERAGHQPEMQDAVQRSKERIEDAQATIEFLLQKPSPAPR
jgi:hypothetical protein